MFRNKSNDWTKVTVNGTEIESTPGHKYFLPETKTWVSAQDLKKGTKVLLTDGTYGIVEAVKPIHYDVPQTTYNFEVEDFHTYYVGTGVLVHNLNCGFGEYYDGMEMSVDDALDAANNFLGEDYVELPTRPGETRFVSNNGMGPNQVRMNISDITGAHGPGPHINFDLISPKFKTIHIKLIGL